MERRAERPHKLRVCVTPQYRKFRDSALRMVPARFPAPPVRVVGSDDASQGWKRTPHIRVGGNRESYAQSFRCQGLVNPRSLSQTSPVATRPSAPAPGSADRPRDRGARESSLEICLAGLRKGRHQAAEIALNTTPCARSDLWCSEKESAAVAAVARSTVRAR